jgi:hypothetical protein
MRFARILLSVLLALAGSFQPGDAQAAPAGTGTVNVTIDTTGPLPYPMVGTLIWNNQNRAVFGRTVNLGTSVGSMNIDGLLSPPTFSFFGTADGSSNLFFDFVNGAYVPTGVPPTISSSSVSDAINLVGTAVGPGGTQLPAGPTFAYTSDAHSDCTNLLGILTCSGVVALNAFEAQPTPAGELVTTTVSTTFFNPITETEIPVTVDVFFPHTVSPGDTQVTTFSNAAGNIPSNFAIQGGTWRGTFVDVTTTAGYEGFLGVCITYPDSAPADGVVDGSEESVDGGISECDLRLLHKENETFTDVTAWTNYGVCRPPPAGVCPRPPYQTANISHCIDTINNKICGLPYGLSPFVVAAQLRAQAPALSPRGVLALGAALALAGAACLGVPPWCHRRALT